MTPTEFQSPFQNSNLYKKPLRVLAATALCASLVPAGSIAFAASDTSVPLQADEAAAAFTPEELVAETEQLDAQPSLENAGNALRPEPVLPETGKQDEAPGTTASPNGKAAAVASVGQATFVSLQEAFTAVPAGVQTTVTLTADISGFQTADIAIVEAQQNILLDLAGHSITVSADFAGRPIQNFGTLTITGNGTIDASASTTGYGAIRNDGGTLTILNGRYIGSVWGDGSAIRNGAGSQLVVKGGYFAATAAVYNVGTARIYAGEFETLSCSACGTPWAYALNNTGNGKISITPARNEDVKVHGSQGALAVVGGADGTVTGGTFYTEPCAYGHAGNAFYALYVSGVASDSATCSVTGGVFTTEGSNACVYIHNTDAYDNGGQPGKAVVKISGGSFTPGSRGAKLITFNEANNSNLAISGGSFVGLSSTELERYAAGQAVQINPDGTVLVGSSIPQPSPAPTPTPTPTPAPAPAPQTPSTPARRPATTGALSAADHLRNQLANAINPLATLENEADTKGYDALQARTPQAAEEVAEDRTPLSSKQQQQEEQQMPLWPFVLLFTAIAAGGLALVRKLVPPTRKH